MSITGGRPGPRQPTALIVEPIQIMLLRNLDFIGIFVKIQSDWSDWQAA
jgi:hypothetical protein